MRRGWFLVAVGALLLLPAAPVAVSQAPTPEPYDGCSNNPQTCDPVAANGGVVRSGDDPVRVILYAHVMDPFPALDWVLNVDPPASNEPDSLDPMLMPTLYVHSEPSPCCQFRNNEFTMTFTPSPVVIFEPGEWSADVHRMMAYDVPMIGSHIQVFVYVSPEGAPNAADDAVPGSLNDTGVVPNLGLYARAYAAHDIEYGHTIAEGDTGGYGDVPPPADSGMTLISMPGEEPVYELRAFLPVEYPWLHGPHEDEPTRPESWGLAVDGLVYQVDGNDVVSFTDSSWRFRAGAQYPPRVVFDTTGVLRFEEREIARLPDRGYAFNWTVRGAFGSLDVDETTAEILVQGPVTFEPELVEVDKGTDHSRMTEPVTLHWRSPEAMERVPDGTYKLHATVRSSQGTYELSWDEGFTVKNGAPVPSDTVVFEGSAHVPAPSALAALLGLGLIIGVRARR